MTFLFQKILMVKLSVVNQCSIIRHERTVAMKKTDVVKPHVDVEVNMDSTKANVSMEIKNK